MKKLIRITAAIAVPLYVLVFLLFMLPNFGKASVETPPSAEIAELWHVDIFEGGSGSRGEFLKRRAVEYEKNNAGKFILIKTLTYNQLINNLSEGRRADMYSFGAGLAYELMPLLCSFIGNATLYDNILDSGTIEGKLFALPWCTGAYMVAAIAEYTAETDYKTALALSARRQGKKELYSFTVGYSEFNNPLLAAYLCNRELRLSGNSFNEAHYSQYDAYQKFAGKSHSVFLLGTQRDAVRLSVRENAADYTMQSLHGFTDLACYVGISKDSARISLCTGFAEYILEESVQRKLTEINMFSVNLGGLYNEGIMSEMEKGIPSSVMPNAFISTELLQENRALVLNALKGDEASVQKILDMFPQ